MSGFFSFSACFTCRSFFVLRGWRDLPGRPLQVHLVTPPWLGQNLSRRLSLPQASCLLPSRVSSVGSSASRDAGCVACRLREAKWSPILEQHKRSRRLRRSHDGVVRDGFAWLFVRAFPGWLSRLSDAITRWFLLCIIASRCLSELCLTS